MVQLQDVEGVGGGGWCPHCMYTVVTSSVSSSSQGSFRMHLISSIMDSHKEGASLTPDRRGVCLSREGGSGVYREGSEGVPKFKNAVTCGSNCATTFTTLWKCDCVKCASLPSVILPPLNKSGFSGWKQKLVAIFNRKNVFKKMFWGAQEGLPPFQPQEPGSRFSSFPS